MKVVNAFIHIFSLFVFLTMGSFLIIVAFHLISLEDALRTVNELYAEPLRSLQVGLMGFLFIIVGLVFAKFLIKNSRGDDAWVFHGENGSITISVKAIEDIVKKILKKFEPVRDAKLKTIVQDRALGMKIKLTVWSGTLIPELTQDVQNEVRVRLEKLLGVSEKVEVQVTVSRIVAGSIPVAQAV